MHHVTQNLLIILAALGPIFFMIVLGYLLQRKQFPGEAFWPAAERLTYFLLFPALLIHKLALAEFGNYDAIPLAGVIVIVLLSMSLLLFLLRPALRVTGPVFSSIYQGSIRFNTYVGLAASGALFLQPGSTVAALAIAVLIPIINVLCVIVLTHSAGGKGLLVLLRVVVRNPLILACTIGVFLNISGIGLPLGSDTVFDILSRAALPLGLLAVGAGLRLEMALGWSRELLLAAVLKLLALPALMALVSVLLGLSYMEMAILVLFAALPGAPSSYILARQLGGDAQLMAAIVTLETGLSLLTLPIVLLLVM
jgi:hypothetical protein